MSVIDTLSAKRSQIHTSIFYYCLLGIACTLPFSLTLNSLFIILLSINWITEGRLKEKLSIVHNKLALLFISLYFLNLLGLIYTTDLKAGLSDTETKLSLLVFPLILSTSARMKRTQAENLLGVFVMACVAGMGICLARAIYEWLVNHDNSYLFYHDLSGVIGMHAVYFAMYVSFCIGILMYLYLAKRYWFAGKGKLKAGAIILIIGMIAFVLMLASKVVIISVLLLANIFLISFSFRKHYRRLLIYVLLANVSIAIALTSIPNIRERFANAWHSEFGFIRENEYDIHYTGVTLRVVMAKFTIDILNNTQSWIFGVGTGDGQTYLDEAYVTNGLYTGNPNLNDRGYLGYNAHNQYFQYLLSLGIVGLLMYLLSLAVPALLAIRYHHYLYLFFLLLFAAGSLSESNLCTQKGVVFFAFFNSLFAFHLLPLPSHAKNTGHM